MSNREFPRNILIEAIQATNLEDDARIRDEYSGRGDYGRTCFGVTLLTTQDALRLVAALGIAAGVEEATDEDSELSQLVTDLVESAYFDSMGHDVILYFRGWQLSDELTGAAAVAQAAEDAGLPY